jgi:hypothetical protein
MLPSAQPYLCSIIANQPDWSTHRPCHSFLAKRCLGIHQSLQDGRLRRPTPRCHAGQIQGSPNVVVLYHFDCGLRIWYHRYHDPKHHYASLVIHHLSLDWCICGSVCKWRKSKISKFPEFIFLRSSTTSADGSPQSSTPAMAPVLLRTPS